MSLNQMSEDSINQERINGQNAFLSQFDEYLNAEPDFRGIKETFRKIQREFLAFKDDFNVLLEEPAEYGGGVENNAGRITNMKEAMAGLRGLIESVDSMIQSNDANKGFEKQAEEARKTYKSLEQAIASL